MENLLPYLEPYLIIITNKKNYNLLRVDFVPGTMLSTLDRLSQIIQWDRHSFLHFMEGYTESQKNWLVHGNVSGMWQNCDLNMGLSDS